MNESVVLIWPKYGFSSRAVDLAVMFPTWLILPCFVVSFVADKLGSSYPWAHAIICMLSLSISANGSISKSSIAFETILIWGISQCLSLLLQKNQKHLDKIDRTYIDEPVLGWKSSVNANISQEEILGPLLFPSRTTHRRLIPTQHSFGYSYLLAGIPVCDYDIYRNDMLSSHSRTSAARQAWFSIHSTDYLQRGHLFLNVSLGNKLKSFLADQGVPSDWYPYAYLVTAPRFLGWSFNPVSFWYLYDKNKVLAAMVLEVNNTFDERRMYLLQPEVNDGIARCLPAKKFSAKWKKDFHVSPFNDRQGAYTVSAADIAATRIVDVTIVLSDMHGNAKLIARIYSQPGSGECNTGTDLSIDPTTMKRRAKLAFLLRHGWKGFLTNPRILRQAWTLWRKDLAVFFRPEPLPSSIGRSETDEEIVIEQCFVNILQFLSKRNGVDIEYNSAAGLTRGKIVHVVGKIPARKGEDGSSEKISTALQIRVLSPQFYTELAGTRSAIITIFDQCGFDARKGEALVWVSNWDALHALLDAGQMRSDVQINSTVHEMDRMGILLFARNLAEHGLQRAVVALGGSTFDSRNATALKTYSELDGLVSHVLNAPEASVNSKSRIGYGTYIRSIFKTVVARQIAFGSVALLKLEERVVRIAVTLLLTGLMSWTLSRWSAG